VTHQNVIANVLQMESFELTDRTRAQQDVTLGILPQSHIYGLIMAHLSAYRGESVIVLPKFTLESLAQAIQNFKVNVLIIVSLQRSGPSSPANGLGSTHCGCDHQQHCDVQILRPQLSPRSLHWSGTTQCGNVRDHIRSVSELEDPPSIW
jgi:hypothetical protein